MNIYIIYIFFCCCCAFFIWFNARGTPWRSLRHGHNKNVATTTRITTTTACGRQQDTLASCALLTFHYPVKYSKVNQAAIPYSKTHRRTNWGLSSLLFRPVSGHILVWPLPFPLPLPRPPIVIQLRSQLIIYAKRVLFGFYPPLPLSPVQLWVLSPALSLLYCRCAVCFVCP